MVSVSPASICRAFSSAFTAPIVAAAVMLAALALAFAAICKHIIEAIQSNNSCAQHD